jgi:hypothetical protein
MSYQQVGLSLEAKRVQLPTAGGLDTHTQLGMGPELRCWNAEKWGLASRCMLALKYRVWTRVLSRLKQHFPSIPRVQLCSETGSLGELWPQTTP